MQSERPSVSGRPFFLARYRKQQSKAVQRFSVNWAGGFFPTFIIKSFDELAAIAIFRKKWGISMRFRYPIPGYCPAGLFFLFFLVFSGFLHAQTQMSGHFTYDKIFYDYTLTYNAGLVSNTYNLHIAAVPDSLKDPEKRREQTRNIDFLVRVQNPDVATETGEEDIWDKFLKGGRSFQPISRNEILIEKGKVIASYQITLERVHETYFNRKYCPRPGRKKMAIITTLDEALFNVAEMFIKGSGCLFGK